MIIQHICRNFERPIPYIYNTIYIVYYDCIFNFNFNFSSKRPIPYIYNTVYILYFWQDVKSWDMGRPILYNFNGQKSDPKGKIQIYFRYGFSDQSVRQNTTLLNVKHCENATSTPFMNWTQFVTKESLIRIQRTKWNEDIEAVPLIRAI